MTRMESGMRLTALFVIISSLVAAASSHAQATSEPVTVVSHVDIIPDAYRAGSQENAGRLLRAESLSTQKDAGIVSYVVLQENGLPNHFTIVEVWHDVHAYELHIGSVHTVNFRRDIQPFIGSPFDSRLYRQLQ